LAAPQTPIKETQTMSSIASPADVNAFVASSPASAAGSGLQEAEDKFLKLLVTQLRNQDPLNPMDNAQMTSQMAQIRTVSGVEKLNATMSALATSLLAGQSLQAASMLGRQVLVPGQQLALADGAADAALELAQAAEQVTVAINDASGKLVHQVNLGPQPAGLVQFRWDGATDAGTPAADGAYSFVVSAQQAGQPVLALALAQGRVAGVLQGKEGASLMVEGIGKVPLSAVKQVM
jgi:flagellar basal-body rod modification protein FlgD